MKSGSFLYRPCYLKKTSPVSKRSGRHEFGNFCSSANVVCRRLQRIFVHVVANQERNFPQHLALTNKTHS